MSELTRSGAAPDTTIWRHVHALIDNGDVLRCSVETDRRAWSLQLSQGCADGMSVIFDSMREAFEIAQD